MSTISFSAEYLINILSSYELARNKHFELFGLYNSRIIFGNDGTILTRQLTPNNNLWFKEISDGSVEFITIIGCTVNEDDEPVLYDEMLARYINNVISDSILVNT